MRIILGLEGIQQVQAQLAAILDRIRSPRQLLLRLVVMVLDEAKRQIEIGGDPPWAPTKPPSNRHHILIWKGTLLSSLSATNAGSVKWESDSRVQAGTPLAYAGYLQGGTRYMPGRPFLSPTIDKPNPALVEKMRAVAQAFFARGVDPGGS